MIFIINFHRNKNIEAVKLNDGVTKVVVTIAKNVYKLLCHKTEKD